MWTKLTNLLIHDYHLKTKFIMEGSFPITHIDHKINIDTVTVDPDILYAPVLET